MGTNNKARRAAKARRRAKQASQRRSAQQQSSSTPWGDRHDDSTGQRPSQDDLPVEHELHRLLAAIWARGWQPTELLREIRRSTKGALAYEVARRLIAVDHARRAPESLHQHWQFQIDSLELPDAAPTPGWLAEVLGDTPAAQATELTLLIMVLRSLRPLPRLIPPPGGTAADVDIAHAAHAARPSDPVLERVRALLAQAESTNYPAEAEAFTAKAHELITRHAIDAAMIAGDGDGWITAARIAVDDPYVDTKSLLLQIVAESSRCRAVFHSGYAMSTVIGASDDLAAVQLLFTSLLLQAQQALLAQGDMVPAGARQRSRSYRTSFLFAFANRIGERLAAVSASTAADVQTATGMSVLPVLAHRLEAVDDALEELFGPLSHSRISTGWDAAGWENGRNAANRARLGDADLTAGGPERLPLAG